jgi:Flp pilus assembly protein TadG
VEAMIALPVIVMVLLLGVAAGRVTVATAAVEAAARDAARQASITRSATEARAAATASAMASLHSQGQRCGSVHVGVDTSGFGRPVGSPATVSADVSCTVPLSDLGLPGLPGSVVKRSRFTSPLDPYRGRR